ncbi:MAG: hypothetical protein WBC44_05100 [Planctomycetaceae bacterium]
MWCDRCRTDAAAEISSSTGHAACATCGHDLGSIRRPATDHARELLKKWSAGIDLEEKPEPIVARPDLTAPTPSRDSALADMASADRDRVRRPAEPVPPPCETEENPASIEPLVVSMPFVAPDETPSAIRIDAAHAEGAKTPHFDVQMAIAARSEKSGNASQVIGQVLAYAGVLSLTVGTALVIWSYFGGESDYAPTGWLVATGGQMLLFLGVVTLVAGSLEQTNRDVRVRVESIGERLARIEQIAVELAKQNRANTADARSSRRPEKTRLRA